MTPTIAIVQIESLHWRTPRLWLPLFLLWVPVLLLGPLVLLVLAAVCAANRISAWRFITASWAILCSLPGTQVRVSTRESKVLVRIL